MYPRKDLSAGHQWIIGILDLLERQGSLSTDQADRLACLQQEPAVLLGEDGLLNQGASREDSAIWVVVEVVARNQSWQQKGDPRVSFLLPYLMYPSLFSFKYRQPEFFHISNNLPPRSLVCGKIERHGASVTHQGEGLSS
jgi:hypothetical protein